MECVDFVLSFLAWSRESKTHCRVDSLECCEDASTVYYRFGVGSQFAVLPHSLRQSSEDGGRSTNPPLDLGIEKVMMMMMMMMIMMVVVVVVVVMMMMMMMMTMTTTRTTTVVVVMVVVTMMMMPYVFILF